MSRKLLLIVLIVVASAVLSAGCAASTPSASVPAPQPIALASAKTQATTEPVAAPAAFNTPPAATQPTVPAPTSDIADAFDSGLQRLVSGDATTDPSISSLQPDERELLSTVLDSLSVFRMALRNGDGLMATRVAPLISLSDRIKSQTPLTLPVVALCRSVTQFGVYESYQPAQFSAGRETPLIVYCEVDNFTSHTGDDGRFETKLNYAAVLYNDNGGAGGAEPSAAVIAKKPASIVDRCRNRRRDFFLADRLTLPATLPAGKYILKVTVVDELANHVAEQAVPVLIAGS